MTNTPTFATLKLQNSLAELQELIRSGKISEEEIVEESRKLFEKYKDKKILISQTYDNDNINEGIKKDSSSNLKGIPIVLKDNICTKGVLTTCASKMLSNFIPDYDAEIVTKIKKAGMKIIGKANMDEFAMGSYGNYSYYGSTINPWTDEKKTEYFCGGSSSGSAAAVAYGLSPFSIGTDTGGSVRVPAAWCGIVGFKPTYGSISRYGIIPLSSTLDTVSLFARNVQDIKPLFELLVGKDDKDASSIDLNALEKQLNFEPKKKVAIIKELNDCPDILPSLDKVKNYFEKIGYIIEEISVPEVNYCLSLYANIVPMETMSNYARYDGLRYGLQPEKETENYEDYCTTVRSQGFGQEVQRRIIAGAYMASKVYGHERAIKTYGVKRLIENKLHHIFEQYDFILKPTTYSYAVALDALDKQDPISIVNTDRYAVLGNIIGAPTVSIAIDKHIVGMPIAVSLMAAPLNDRHLLNIAEDVDNHFSFHKLLSNMQKELYNSIN